MPPITIVDLVRNGTMNAEIAAVLWAAVDEQVSFLTVAIPRFAGKSTTSKAVLAMRPEGVPAHLVAGEAAVMDRFKRDRIGGYLIVDEFSRAPIPGYIWGEPVRRVFDTLEAGYSLQTALHAPSVEDAIQEVTVGNQISDELASTFKLVLYIERFGTDLSDFWRRLTDVYEVHAVEDGRPIGHSLFRWQAENDQFQKLTEPHQWGQDRADLELRTQIIDGLARDANSGPNELALAVKGYRSQHQSAVTTG